MKNQPEQQLQIACAHWLDIQRRMGKLTYFHVPNGGRRGKREAWVLKKMGVRAGVPDLVIGVPGGKIFFVELKAPKGSLSADQKEMHAELSAMGLTVYTVKSLDQLLNVVNEMKGSTP